MSSNGLASGNHASEATLHGLCEVIERDANTLWHAKSASERARARLRLRSVTDADCAQLIARVERAGFALGVWETTSDVGVASFLAQLVEADPSPFGLGPVSGSGCHPAREVALLRAITEAAQGRLTIISGARDDLTAHSYSPAEKEQRAQSALTRLAEAEQRDFSDTPSWASNDVEGDLTWVLARLRNAGLEQAVTVDLSLPEFELPVVRVVVPGLELMHDMPGYVPGARARAARGLEQ